MGKKVERLVDVVRMCYEQDRTQSKIAVRYGISGPMIGKLLKEAGDVGVVTIHIQAPEAKDSGQISLMKQMGRKLGIYKEVVVRDGPSDHTTSGMAAETAIHYLENLGEGTLGIGRGYVIGDVVRHVGQRSRLVPVRQAIYPLIGNDDTGLRNYHSNELVHTIAKHSGVQLQFIYSPVYMPSEQRLELIKTLDNYRKILRAREKSDITLANIGNFPSVPGSVSKIRYGGRLMKQKAVGKIFNYYTNVEGRVIRSRTDYAMRIPLELLTRTEHVVGIYSANTSPKTLRGALKTGYLGYILTPEHVARDILKQWAEARGGGAGCHTQEK